MDPNLNFDGMEKISPKQSSKYHTNHYTGYMNDGREINNGTQPVTSGTPVTKDAFRRAPAAAVPSLPAQGSVRDSINRGAQVRNPGGTRAWDPKKGQNYAGNPDSIRIGQSGGPNYGQTSKGKTPSTRAGSDTFNYGPKSQY